MKTFNQFIENADLKQKQIEFEKKREYDAGNSGSGTFTGPVSNSVAQRQAKNKEDQIRKILASEEMGTGLTIKGPTEPKGTVSRGTRERKPGVKPRQKTVEIDGKLTRVPSSYNMKKKDPSGSTSGQYPSKSVTTSQRTSQPEVRDPEGRKEVEKNYAKKVKDERRAAALARRKAREGGQPVQSTTTSSQEAEKKATELLRTRQTPKPSKPKPKSEPLVTSLDSKGNPKSKEQMDKERNEKKKNIKNSAEQGYKNIYNKLISQMDTPPTKAQRIKIRLQAKEIAKGINSAN